MQRFVDAANLRNANAMAALVAPDAVFARFPGGQVIAQNRVIDQERGAECGANEITEVIREFLAQ